MPVALSGFFAQTKERGARLNAFAPLKTKVALESGMMLEYQIVKKAAFTVVGVSRGFRDDTAYRQILEFWTPVRGRCSLSRRACGRVAERERSHLEGRRPGRRGCCLGGNYIEWYDMEAENQSEIWVPVVMA